MCKNSIHTTGAAASAVNELCTDRGSVCVTNSESTHDEPLYCRISTQKAIYKIPYQDILFIESEQKKSVIHLLKKTILSLTTLPILVLRRFLSTMISSFQRTEYLLFYFSCFLCDDCLDSCDVLTNFLDSRCIVQLVCCILESQVEQLFLRGNKVLL